MTSVYDLIFGETDNWKKEILITNKSRYSLNDIHSKVNQFVHLLQLQGDIKGKKIAAIIPDITMFFSLFVAVNKLEGIFVPINYQFRNDDLTSVLTLLKPTIIFTVKERNGVLYDSIISEWAKNNNIQTIIFSYSDNYEEFEKKFIEGNLDQKAIKDCNLITCTSGSTGVPKGVKLKVESVFQWTKRLISGLDLKKEDCIFLTIPVTAVYGICWLLTGFSNRIKMVIPENFDIPVVLNLLKENPCNKIATTPSIFKSIYAFAKEINPDSLNRLELGCLAGEQINKEFIEQMKDFKNCRLINHYGSSEQGVLMFTNDIRSEVVEWTVTKGNEYKVDYINEEGIGELMFKTPFGFEGYYQNEKLTKEVLTPDGWFHTGDLVRINENGKLEIVGRKKQLIKKGGVQVIPGEIEHVLSQHPNVLQSAVVGIPHSVYGEDIIAFVVLKKDEDLKHIFEFLRERIAPFKVPSRIIKIDKMPIIQGKLDKVTLKKMAVSS